MLLSIIIVNYNGKQFLKNCLESIQLTLNCSYEIIIVDNNSSDDSVKFIEKNYPFVRLIKSKINHGFSKGNNIGAKKASGKYILLLNNDTVILNFPFSNIEELIKNENTIVGCRMYYENGDQQFSYGYEHSIFNIFIFWLGLGEYSRIPKRFKRIENHYHFYENENDKIQWISGAFMLMSKNLFIELDGFDENIFMYMEDVDLCKRALKRNTKIVYTPKISITHFEGSGKEWIGEKAIISTINSYFYYIRKHYPLRSEFHFRILLSFAFFSRLIYNIILYLIRKTNLSKQKIHFFRKASYKILMGKI